MATLAPGGRITVEVVEEEIARLKLLWTREVDGSGEILAEAMGPGKAEEIDLFDRVQLSEVIRIARGCLTLSDAGRLLFGVSRLRKKAANDADRLSKYLGRFGLAWEDVCGRIRRPLGSDPAGPGRGGARGG